jgi:NADPH:quinone reductase-like Zn-dependent oxidoreductase
LKKPQIAFECIGGDTTGLILNTLEENGTLYHYGNLSLRNCSNISTHDLLFMDKKILGFWLFKYLKNLKESPILHEFFKFLEKHPDIFTTQIQAVFNPENFESALKVYRSDMSQGKVLFDFSEK